MSRNFKATPIEDIAAASGAAAGEHVWLDVIQKMDEVYHELLDYEVALEEKNSALEESQQFIVSVLTSMSDILIVCNRGGRIEDVNPSLLALTGRSEESLQGASLFDLFADEDSRRRVQQHLAGHMGEILHDCELSLLGRDQTPVPVSLNCTPRYNSVGKMLGIVITGRPVGELRRAYQALHQTHEELKRTQQQLLHSEKMASLGRLVAGVAHELNNPISFVLGNVVALRRYVERIDTYLDAVHHRADAAPALRQELRIDKILEDLPSLIEGTVEGAERTRDVVDGLKRFSVMDRDEKATFDLVPVIERAVHWVSSAMQGRVQMCLDLPESILVSGSSGQMQQVLMNLVQNAADATAGQAEQRLTISARLADGQAVIEFHDNGPGIAAENLPRIFDPFFTTKPVGQGTGLGLAISYGIVERHDGKLAVANHAKGGAVFNLTLPLVQDH
ncbi:MAG TPA: ATP-binding protein [Rhodocyclaceae bacterium]|nr:ATP-binding protein [Rhodocyclaceae bacterium]